MKTFTVEEFESFLSANEHKAKTIHYYVLSSIDEHAVIEYSDDEDNTTYEVETGICVTQIEIDDIKIIHNQAYSFEVERREQTFDASSAIHMPYEVVGAIVVEDGETIEEDELEYSGVFGLLDFSFDPLLS